MRQQNHLNSYFSFFNVFSPFCLKTFFFLSGIFLNFLNSASLNATSINSSTSLQFPTEASQSPTLPIPEALKPPSSDLPSFTYIPEKKDSAINKYNPEAKDALKAADPL